MTESQILSMLRRRYPVNEYAMFDHVRNGTGFGSSVRTLDAIALSLWPSRGLELLGFEIKCSRKDLFRELKDPAKTDEFFAYLHRFYMVIAGGIAKRDEIPLAWGILEESEGQLRMVRESPLKTDPKPLDVSLVASLLRNAAKREEASFQARLASSLNHAMEAERAMHTEQIEKLDANIAQWSERAHRVERELAQRPDSRDELMRARGQLMWLHREAKGLADQVGAMMHDFDSRIGDNANDGTKNPRE